MLSFAEHVKLCRALCSYFLVDNELIAKHKLESCVVKRDELLKDCEKQHGESNEEVRAYLDSNYDPERHSWINLRLLAKHRAMVLGMTNEEHKSFWVGVLNNGCLLKGSNLNPVSNIFGDGVKADYGAKAELYRKILNRTVGSVELTHEGFRQIIVECCGRNNADESKSVLKGGSTGRDSYLIKRLLETKTGLIDEKTKSLHIKKIEQDIKEQSGKSVISHREKFSQYYILKFGQSFYYAAAFNECWNHNTAVIDAKFSHNLSYVTDKVESIKELEDLSKDPLFKDAHKVLRDFIDKNSITGAQEYSIGKPDLGDLKRAFELQDEKRTLTDILETDILDQLKDESDTEKKPFNRQLVEHILKNRSGISVDSFYNACNHINKYNKLQRHKPHPFVTGNAAYTFGLKNIYGFINDPFKRDKSGIPYGAKPVMWLTAQVWDGKEWEIHHFMFNSSRFYEEVYFVKEGLPILEYARQPKYGISMEKKLSVENAKSVADTDKKHRLAFKAIKRVEENATHNVAWDQSITFGLGGGNNDLNIIINYRHAIRKAKKEIEVGDKILSFDVGMKSPTAYAVIEKVDSGGIAFNDGKYKVVKTGDISAYVSSKGEERNVLEYMGVPTNSPYSEMRELIKNCRKFIESCGNDELMEKFDSLVGLPLYEFHRRYCRLSIKSIQEGLKSGAINLSQIRDHLQFYLFDNRFNPLKKHSLALGSLDASRAVNSLIYSYFGHNNWIEDGTRLSEDPVLYNCTKKIAKGVTNRRRERSRLISTKLLEIALRHSCTHVVGEGGLPKANSAASRGSNNSLADWCAKQVGEKFSHMCLLAGINYREVPSHFTSHQHPFKHTKKNPCMNARFQEIEVSKLGEYDLRYIKNVLKKKSPTGTMAYYQRAFNQMFLVHYDIILDDILACKKIEEFRKLFSVDKILMPKKYGKFYLAEMPLTDKCESIKYAGREYFKCHSDQIAALNIGCWILSTTPG